MKSKKIIFFCCILSLAFALSFESFAAAEVLSYNHVSSNSQKEYKLVKIDPASKNPLYAVASLTSRSPFNKLDYSYILWTSRKTDTQTQNAIISYLQKNAQGNLKKITRGSTLFASENGYAWKPVANEAYSVSFYRSRIIFSDTSVWSAFAYGSYSGEVTNSIAPENNTSQLIVFPTVTMQEISEGITDNSADKTTEKLTDEITTATTEKADEETSEKEPDKTEAITKDEISEFPDIADVSENTEEHDHSQTDETESMTESESETKIPQTGSETQIWATTLLMFSALAVLMTKDKLKNMV